MHINKIHATYLALGLAAIVWVGRNLVERRRRKQRATIRLQIVSCNGWPLEGPIGKVLD